jgi:hypothetical protein
MFGPAGHIVIATIGLASASQTLDRQEFRGLGKESLSALVFFTSAMGTSPDAYLRQIRPRKVDFALRAQVIAALPPEGEIRPSKSERAKLAKIDAILRYHERDSDIDIKLIRVDQAFVGLHARTVLLVSQNALDLLSAEELDAVAGHEIGHEYFWTEYGEANRRGEHSRLRELELRCDGIAILTLAGLGRDPSALASGLTKLLRFNERISATADANKYVPHVERLRFLKAMIQLLRRTH